MTEFLIFFFLNFYSSENCHLSVIHSWNDLAVFGPISLTHVQNFAHLKQVWSLGFLSAALCDVFVRFFCLIFQNGVQPSARFTGYKNSNIEFGLFCVWEHRKQKYAGSWLSLTRWQCLRNQASRNINFCLASVWKT